MPANVFDVFMGQHPPIGKLVDHANSVLWDESALSPSVKERMRIALAEEIGCSYCARFRTNLDGHPVLAGGASDPAVVPKQPAASKLYELVHKGEMPLDHKTQVSAAEMETVRLWIERLAASDAAWDGTPARCGRGQGVSGRVWAENAHFIYHDAVRDTRLGLAWKPHTSVEDLPQPAAVTN